MKPLVEGDKFIIIGDYCKHNGALIIDEVLSNGYLTTIKGKQVVIEWDGVDFDKTMELKVGDKVKLIKDIEISYNGFANGGFIIPKDTILYYKCKSINPRGSILYSGEYGEISIPDCYFIKED